MKCPNCSRDVADEDLFCTSCGENLLEALSEESADDGPDQVGTFEELVDIVQILSSEVRDIRSMLARVGIRPDDAGVQTQRATPTPPVASPSPPSSPATATTDAATPTRTARIAARAREAGSPPERDRPPAAEAAGGAPRRPSFEINWELIIGENWMARVGILAVVIGVGLFLQQAFENNWIGPAGRISLGIVAGLALLAASQYWLRRYPIYAQALAGGGIGVLYLSIFAAFGLYQMIGFYSGVGLLFLVSVTATALAIRHESVALAVLGIVGAFAAPFLLGVTAPDDATVAQSRAGTQLMAYVIIVDLGVLALSTLRNWRWFTLLGLIGSLIFFGMWYAQYGPEASLTVAQGSLTIIFLIFVGATTLFHIIWRRAPQAFDQALMVINVAAFFGITYGLLWTDFRAWMGAFTLLLSLSYGGLAYAAIRRSREHVNLSFFALGIALVLLTIALPVQIGGPWVSVAWAAEGAVLIWLSFTLRMWQLRIFGIAIFGLFLGWLLFLDTLPALTADVTPLLNEYFPVILLTTVATYIAAALIRRNSARLEEWEPTWFPFFLVAANSLVTIAIPTQVGGVWVAVLWSVEALVLIGVSIRLGLVEMRLFGLGTLIVMAVRLTAFDGPAAFNFIRYGEAVTPIFNIYMLGSALSIASVVAAAFIVRRYASRLNADEKWVFPAVVVLAALLFTFTVPVQLEGVWVPIVWAGTAVAIVWGALRLDTRELRFFGYVVLGAMTLWLLAAETFIDPRAFTLIVNPRMAAFLIGILALYAAGALLYRRTARLEESERIFCVPTLLIVANFVTLWILSAEVIATVDSDIIAASGQVATSMKSLGLSLVWAVYASLGLAFGIWRRSKYVRLGSLALLAVPIVKLFLVDSFALEQLYRVFAFLSLGLILLIAGFLYQKYSATIKGFLFE